MWLLKLHVAISVLCFLTVYGFMKLFKEQITKNGWINQEQKKKEKITNYLFFFVPILNIFMVLVVFLMIGMKKADFEELTGKEHENDMES